MTFSLFTDASVHTQSRTGVGAYLWLADIASPSEHIMTQIKTHHFSDTSSSQCELQTLLWAFDALQTQLKQRPFTLYTDCQNIVSLPARRQNLEQKTFCNARQQRLQHADLYQQFYSWCDTLNFKILKISGHKASAQKNELDKIFALVDQAARRVLRG
ncbi:MAG: RNase H family protein [Marinagarivorans sp.]|nr:RNase H family protein [Marinagarivorans sp.]